MKVKVVSDGSGAHTRVYGHTGYDVTNDLPIRAVSWRVEAGDAASVSLELDLVSTEIEGEADVYIRHPVTKRLERVNQIKFADGSSWDFAAPAWTFKSADPVVEITDSAQAGRIATAVDAQVRANVSEQLKRQMHPGGTLNRI